MNIPRLLRTVRHVTATQLLAMAQRRARHALRRARPDATRLQLTEAVRDLPLPRPTDPRLRAIAGHVLPLQQTVHAAGTVDLDRGYFEFLGRTVEFGALDRIDWRRDLGENSSPLWRLTLAYFGWAVEPLASGNIGTIRQITESLRRLEHATPWTERGVFRDVWNPYTASHRLINLLSGLALGSERAAWTDADVQGILQHVQFCAAFILSDLEQDLQLNHLLKNYLALATYAASLAQPPPTFDFLARAVPVSLDQVVLPDGGHAERSPLYHALGLLDLRMLRDSRIFQSAWQPDLDRRIEAMEQALGLLTHPDGDIALFNDAWHGAAPRAATIGAVAPSSGRHDLPITGYSRLDGGADVVVLDAGPIGPDFNPGHAHADFLSVEASVAGRRFLVDPGTPTYAAGELRDRCRSAASHNGPHLVGEEPIEFWKSFRVGRRGTAGLIKAKELDAAPLWTAGWHDGYRRHGLEPRRWVGLWPGHQLVIIDAWRGYRSQEVSCHFLIPANWACDERTPWRFAGAPSIAVTGIVGALQPLSTVSFWPRYGLEEPASRLTIRPENGVSAIIFRWGDGAAFSPGLAAEIAASLRRAQRIDN